MKQLERYILLRLAVTTLLALVVFVVLYAVFDLIAESDAVGKGNYSVATLFQYIGLRLPVYAYEIAPVAVLIGSLIALTSISSNSEYAVMRTAGLSLRRMVQLLIIFALICAAVSAFIGEWLMPKAYQQSRAVEYNARYGEDATLNHSGALWFKSGQDMVQVESMMPDGTLRNIMRFQMADNPEKGVVVLEQAESAQYQQDDQWQLFNVQRSTLEDTQVQSFRQPEKVIWKSKIDPNLLRTLIVEPQEMSIFALSEYIQYLKENKQRTSTYEVGFWRKIFYPFGSLAMAIIALVFTPLIARHANMGWRIFLGMCFGVAFHFAGRFFSFYADLFHLPPLWAGFLPVFILTLLAIFGVWRWAK